MSCKKGDRALVLNGTHSYGVEGNSVICLNTLRGAVTTCIELHSMTPQPMWLIDALHCSTCKRELLAAWDSVLKPLPDPDDVRAYDEEREIEHA